MGRKSGIEHPIVTKERVNRSPVVPSPGGPPQSDLEVQTRRSPHPRPCPPRPLLHDRSVKGDRVGGERTEVRGLPRSPSSPTFLPFPFFPPPLQTVAVAVRVFRPLVPTRHPLPRSGPSISVYSVVRPLTGSMKEGGVGRGLRTSLLSFPSRLPDPPPRHDFLVPGTSSSGPRFTVGTVNDTLGPFGVLGNLD